MKEKKVPIDHAKGIIIIRDLLKMTLLYNKSGIISVM